jgi:2,3-bisphosphoglycerate-independent phosphoglycerate mutase
MANFDLMCELQQKSPSKIVLLIMDGLGGLPMDPGGPTELEAANIPNMNLLAKQGTLGQIVPIRLGITPGSGPAHLALFGYDPVKHEIGRGVLEAAGIGLPVNAGDVAARANLCTLDTEGKITDRRAGRISSEKSAPIVKRLDAIEIPGVKIDVRPVKEYRFVVVIRGEGLEPEIDDTDPQSTGVPPLPAKARDPGSEKAAQIFNTWLAAARKVLADEPIANAATLRGFSTDPGLPKMLDIYGLRSACIAVYPMYKGVSSLVGMDVQQFNGDYPEDEFAAAARIWDDYDFFFIHIKKTDSTGEDGNFNAKVKIIESVDAALPNLLKLKPDVLAITGDHSTPARMKTHSWHPVPFLLWAPTTGRPDDQIQFGETYCVKGGLGTFPAPDVMQLLMAHANRLAKFGA